MLLAGCPVVPNCSYCLRTCSCRGRTISCSRDVTLVLYALFVILIWCRSQDVTTTMISLQFQTVERANTGVAESEKIVCAPRYRSPPTAFSVSLFEGGDKRLSDEHGVGPDAGRVGGHHGEDVARVERAGRPAGPAEVDVGVGVQVGELLLDVRHAAGVVTTAKLGVDCLPPIAAEPVGKRAEGRRDVVSDAGGGGTAVVRVGVLVNVEDQVRLRAVGVGDVEEGSAGAVRPLPTTSVRDRACCSVRERLRWSARRCTGHRAAGSSAKSLRHCGSQ